ncbi:hypothetical protein BJ912DRAFT_994981 [Pholiota molesta]|nr:hypothetical protein BJ912DRAFT_994981 [Pholiota molesta]
MAPGRLLSSIALDELPSRLDSSIHSSALLESIIDAADICSHDAVILIEQPGLHASDLRTLSPTTHLAHSLRTSPSARQYPYIPASAPLDLAALGARYPAGRKAHGSGQGRKHVVCMTLPHLGDAGKAGGRRRTSTVSSYALLTSELTSLASAFPNHLVVYTGSLPPAQHARRQARPPPPTAPCSTSPPCLPPLTPALITGLLVAFFLLVPVLYFALAPSRASRRPSAAMWARRSARRRRRTNKTL